MWIFNPVVTSKTEYLGSIMYPVLILKRLDLNRAISQCFPIQKLRSMVARKYEIELVDSNFNIVFIC